MREAFNLAAFHRATSGRAVRWLHYLLVPRNKVHKRSTFVRVMKPVTEMNGDAISIEHSIDPQPYLGHQVPSPIGLAGAESSSPRV